MATTEPKHETCPELTPLVMRVAIQAKHAKLRSDANHDRHGEWTSSDAAADAEMTAWLAALGMVVDDSRGAPFLPAGQVGAAFLEAHWCQIRDPAEASPATARLAPSAHTIS